MVASVYAGMFEFLASRRAVFAFVVLLAGAGILLGLNHLLSHPTETEAGEIVYGNLLRYETLHGAPHVVFHHNERTYFDELERDYKYLLANRGPGWVITGKWYFIGATEEPASVGVARCTGVLGEACGKEIELFGQINSPEITALEVEYDGEWLHFPVEAPGYALRLDDRHEVPAGYRWLNEDGEIVYEQGYAEPLDPGRAQS